jgi:hypothetical protein
LSIAVTVFNVFGLVTLTLPYIQAQQTGVIDLSSDQVVAMQTVPNVYQPYRISGSDMIDTTLDHVTNSDGVEITRSYYGLLRIDDRVLLVGSPDPINEAELSYTGTFDVYVDEELLTAIDSAYPDLEGRLLQVYFSETLDYANTAMTVIVIVQAVVFLVCLMIFGHFIYTTVLNKPPQAQQTA